MNRLTSFLAASVIAAGTLVPLASSAGAATTAVVNPTTAPTTGNGWGFAAETGAGGSGAFVDGPGTPPSGTGSAQLSTTTGADGHVLGTFDLGGTPLADITALQYSTYRSSVDAGNNQAIALQLSVDYDLTDSTTPANKWQGRLVFEPYQGNGGGVPQNTWQTWNPLTAGEWWGSGTPWIANAAAPQACPQSNPCTWAEVAAAYPDAGVNTAPNNDQVLFKAGSGWTGFQGNVDAFTIGVNGNDSFFDFESGTQCTTLCYVDAANGDDAYGGTSPANPKQTIQAAIDTASPGATIDVAAGTYVENVVVDKTVTVDGAGAGATVVTPASGVPNCVGGSLCVGASNVFLVEANDVVIRDLTVDGDNPSLTSGVLSNGVDVEARNGIITNHTAGTFGNLEVHDVTVQNIYLRGIYASSGGTFDFHDNTVGNVAGEAASIAMMNFGGSGAFTDNAVSNSNDGIVSNWSTGTTYSGNQVTNNLSGIHTDNNSAGSADVITNNTVSSCQAGGYGIFVFVPYVAVQVDGNTVTDCEVALSQWGGAAPVTVDFNNNVVDANNIANSVGLYVTTDQVGYGTGDATVAADMNSFTETSTAVQVDEPGSTATVTLTRNSIAGNAAGVVNNAAGEVAATCNWWGAANGPSGAALGSGDSVSTNVSANPWLLTSTLTGPCAGAIYVDDDTGNDADDGRTPATAKATIQAGIDAIEPGGSVYVFPGTYSETATNRYTVTGNGPHQFGLFVGDAKDGITVQGIDNSAAAITNAANVAARVNTSATNNFGPSGIWVEGDDVTIRGLEIGTNSAGQNKTVEVIGDGFTLDANEIDDPDGSVYLNDWRFDVGTDTSYVQSYAITNNLFRGGISLDISEGAGYSGPVSGRQITGNTFEGAAGDPTRFWPSISFNGADTGVPWFVHSVGGAVIQNNTFTGSSQYIRARGTYDNSQFDWASYWSDNTYSDRATVTTTDGNPANVRTFSYTSGSYVFNDVRRIGGSIDTQYDASCGTSNACKAEIDHAVNGDTVLAQGTFAEQVTIDRNITLQGDGVATTTLQGAGGAGAGTGIALSGGLNGVTVADLTVQSYNYGIQTQTGPLQSILFEDLAVVDNHTHGIWSQAFSVTDYTVRRVDASRNNQAGGLSGRGFWMINGTKTNVTVEDGTFDDNGLVGIDISDGEVTGLTITGNTVSGNKDSGIGVLGAEGPGANIVSNNIVTDNGRYGIEIKNSDGNGLSSGPGSVVVTGNSVTRTVAATDARDHGGIVVIRRSPSVPTNPNQPDGIVITLNTVSGYHRKPVGATGDGFGIAVGGTGHVIGYNTVTSNDIGVQVQGGNPGINAQSTDWFDRDDAANGGADVVFNTITGGEVGVRVIGTSTATVNRNSLATNSAFGLNNTTGSSLNGECNWWGASNGPSGAYSGSGTAVSTNVDFDMWLVATTLTGLCPAPKLVVGDAAVVEGDTGTRTMKFRVTLDSPSTAPVTMTYSTSNGSATAPGDYKTKAGSLTFNPGVVVKTVAVTVNPDAAVEGDETFTLTASSVTGAAPIRPTGTGTIVDDTDPGTTLQVGVGAHGVGEGTGGKTNRTVQIVVALNQPAASSVTVGYTTVTGTATEGNDYFKKTGTLTFTPGQRMKTISIPIKRDAVVEADEQFSFTLTPGPGVTAIPGAGSTTVTVFNDDL